MVRRKITPGLSPTTLPPSKLERITAEACRRSFARFVREFWHIAEPAVKYRHNWHIDVVCDRLQKVAERKIRKLIINIPPGFAKSLLTAVLYSAWRFLRNPKARLLFCSHSTNLAERDSVRCRNVVRSELYQRMVWALHLSSPGEYPRWTLTDDQDTKDRWVTTETGERNCLGVDSKTTGYRGDDVIVDDALDAKEAHSDAKREHANHWFSSTMVTRVNIPDDCAFVVVMQRLHEDDLTGFLLAKDSGWELLAIPMEYDPSDDNICPEDPRTEPGEILFPGLYSEAKVKELKIDLGDNAEGQLNQKPAPKGGFIFNPQWWRFWHPTNPGPSLLRPRVCSKAPARVIDANALNVITLSLDCAFKEKSEAKKKREVDYHAFTAWGARGPDRYLLKAFRVRCDFVTLLDHALAFVREFPRYRKFFVESKANGSAIIDSLRRVIQNIIAVEPGGDDKVSRAMSIQGQVRGQNVYLLDGASWLVEYVDEMQKFPRAKHDDWVDSTSQALKEMELSPDAIRAERLLGIA